MKHHSGHHSSHHAKGGKIHRSSHYAKGGHVGNTEHMVPFVEHNKQGGDVDSHLPHHEHIRKHYHGK